MSQPPSRIDRLGLGAALVTVVLWASAFVGIRAAASDLSPGSIALGRLAVGSIALGALVALRGWRRPSRGALLRIVGVGLVWFAFYNVALNEAERNVDAGTAAMLVNIGPIFIALFAGVFLGEGLPARLLVGCAIVFVGTVTIGLATSGAPITGGNATWGILLCVLCALAYATGVTLQKPVLRTVSPLEVTWLACLTGAIACLPFAPSLVSEAAHAHAQNLAWLVYLGLFPTSIAFTTWAFALGRTSAGRLGSTTYLVPPVAIVLGYVVLGEIAPLVAVLGGALCIAGVIVSRSTARPWVRRGAQPGSSAEPATEVGA